jgi:transposase-like protein
MAKSVLNDVRFHNEEAAFAYVEKQLWPKGPVCPHCRAKDDKIGKLSGKTTRTGLYKCYACRKPFTVRIGTIFEDSHLPLRLWLQAIHLMCASKKGISTRARKCTFPPVDTGDRSLSADAIRIIAPLFPLSSAAVTFARSMRLSPLSSWWSKSCGITSRRAPRCIPMKASCI